MPFTSRLSNIISILVGMIRWSSVQIAVQFAISRVGTIEIGNGEGKAGGIEEFKVTVSRCFATVGPSVVGPKVSPAFLSIFLSMDLPSAIGCR